MANLLFKKGSYDLFKEKVLNGTAADGTLYFTEDEGALYIGTSAGKAQRIRGTVQYYTSLTEFTNKVAPPFSTDVIYFIANEDALVRWNGTEWVHLNTTAATAALLEQKINDNTTEIGNVSGALDAKAKELGDKITANTTAIGTNTADITQLKTDVATKASQSDLTALTTRVSTNETNISSLDDLVATKASIEALNGVKNTVNDHTTRIGSLEADITTKATKTELNTLAGRVSTNENEIADLKTRADNAESAIGTINTSINSINTVLSTKANQTDLNNLTNRVADNEDDIETLQETIATKANQSDLADLTTRVGNNENLISGHTQQISSINAALATKASQSDLTALTTRVGTNEADIVQLKKDVATKASQSDLNSLDDRVDNLDTLVAKKAEASALENLSKTVSDNKASAEAGIKEAKDAAAEAQETADDNAAAILTINGELDNLEAALNTKASQTDLTNLTKTVTNLSTTVTNNETDIENKFSNLSAVVDGHGTRLGGHDTDIKNLQDLVATKADKSYVDDIKSQLDTNLNDKILAANAMEYKGIVKSQTELNAITSAKIGYTYVVAATENGGFGSYTNGDLLIATGTEGDDGLISGTITWQHVKTGYIDAHNPSMSLNGNAVTLNSFSGETLGAISITSANESLTVENKSGGLVFNMVWGDF